jgi:hypothetical protein
MTPRPADIGFVRTYKNGGISGFFSRLLAKIMGSRWSHAFLVVDDKTTVETDMKSVHLDHVEDHMFNPDKVCEIWRLKNTTDNEKTWIVSNSLNNLGRPYSYALMLALGIRILFKRKIDTPWKWGIVCHGVPISGYAKSSIPHFFGLKGHELDTEEFYKLVKESGRFERVWPLC